MKLNNLFNFFILVNKTKVYGCYRYSVKRFKSFGGKI